MKFLANCILIGIILSLTIAPIIADATAQSDENKQLKSMISELEIKIEDADKRMIAHPNFLNELRILAQKYKSQLRELFFRDTFSDGNFNKNPQWIVKSGEFNITPEGHLTSFVPMQPHGTKTESPPEKDRTIEQEAVGIILDNIFGSQKKQQKETPTIKNDPTPIEPASIFTNKTFPPAFEMNMTFKSSEGSKLDILLLGSKNLSPRYRLKLKANQSKTDPMEIVREGSSRSFVVGASNVFPVISDGKFHTLTWVRLTDGEMNVLIDGNVVLETYEVFYRDNFTGLAITNNAGTHKFDSIEIFKALKK